MDYYKVDSALKFEREGRLVQYKEYTNKSTTITETNRHSNKSARTILIKAGSGNHSAAGFWLIFQVHSPKEHSNSI